MKQLFILFQRGRIFYCEDTATGKQTSLRTRDRAEAGRLIHAHNEAVRQAAMSLQIAQVYLRHGDPALAARTWQQVLDQIVSSRTGATRVRWESIARSPGLDPLRTRKLVETTAEHFLAVLKAGPVSTNVYLRRIHNFALGMHWLPWPILPRLLWPKVQYK